MTGSAWNNKLVEYVSPSTWNCVELAQLDMSSQLMLPKPLWHPWFRHALITVIPCCKGFLISWLTNFKRFKIVLLDSISKFPKAHMFHHFWLNCTGFQPLRESITKFPLCAMMLSPKLPCHTCLIFFAFTSHPVHSVPLLTPVIFRFQTERKSSKGSMLSLILALSLGTNAPTLYAMLKHNPSSKLN